MLLPSVFRRTAVTRLRVECVCERERESEEERERERARSETIRLETIGNWASICMCLRERAREESVRTSCVSVKRGLSHGKRDLLRDLLHAHLLRKCRKRPILWQQRPISAVFVRERERAHLMYRT